MEKGEFGKAISLFDELIKRYPNSEEASIAELCIAELHFRNKSNDLALKAFERIVELYPQSHAAENARSGIDYLRSIERFENEYVSPDVEARKRKGY
jgi:outer membrane protein assembly factor BamD (BamD/ComL family)